MAALPTERRRHKATYKSNGEIAKLLATLVQNLLVEEEGRMGKRLQVVAEKQFTNMVYFSPAPQPSTSLEVGKLPLAFVIRVTASA